MGPFAEPDGHDGPGLIDQLVPCVAAMVDDIVVGLEDPVRQPVVAHELPDVFDRIEFRAFRWQGQQGDVVGDRQIGGEMPSGLIHHEYGMGARCDGARDFLQVQDHGGCVAKRQDQTGPLSQSRADGAEQIDRLGSLILGSRWPGAASSPTSGDLGLLADAGLVLPPDFYGRSCRLLGGDLVQTGGEVFLNASRAASSWAW